MVRRRWAGRAEEDPARPARSARAGVRGRSAHRDGRRENRCCSELEHDGAILRTRLDGRTAWCERRLLARIHRYTLDALRREIEPVSASEFLQFLACWQHVDEEYMLEGPRGVAEVLRAARRVRGARRGRGRRTCCRGACATTAASGSTS